MDNESKSDVNKIVFLIVVVVGVLFLGAIMIFGVLKSGTSKDKKEEPTEKEIKIEEKEIDGDLAESISRSFSNYEQIISPLTYNVDVLEVKDIKSKDKILYVLMNRNDIFIDNIASFSSVFEAVTDSFAEDEFSDLVSIDSNFINKRECVSYSNVVSGYMKNKMSSCNNEGSYKISEWQPFVIKITEKDNEVYVYVIYIYLDNSGSSENAYLPIKYCVDEDCNKNYNDYKANAKEYKQYKYTFEYNNRVLRFKSYEKIN